MTSIENMNLGNLDAVVPLIREYWAYEGISGFDESKISDLLGRLVTNKSLGSVFLAKKDERIVGYLISVYVFSLEFGGIISEIDELYVASEARKHGVGRLLIKAAEQTAIAKNCQYISLQISKSNGIARQLYLSNGFVDRLGFELLVKPL